MRFRVIVLIGLLFVGCATTPVTNRTQFMMISPDQEMALGVSEAQKVVQSSKISTDKVLQERIKRIGQRIAAVSGRSDFAWEFTVIDDATPNAFCLPGGKVFFYTGILKITENEDQIATVMGHEIAHALARHGAERMSMQTVSNLGAQVLAAALNVPPEYQNLYAQAYGITSQVGLILPYSRKFEHEADQIGIYLMWRAGYNASQALKFWENMGRLSKDSKKTPPFLSTHPADDERIREIRNYIAQLPSQR
ncbi:MAG: peptidase M48 family protein [Sulfuricurvum sp. GWF2_44_89]|uniref:Peptidase M48 family protein n=1 Tax=Sulfuricurvum kujiense TaxID=148813 RepID=A0A2D3WC43_9BACT|nr:MULTISPECIES: M48 family metallopeptidase [Sulfuricurvum]OHD78783.1 MAG: peptidase M48 family protein [Sulfuricurvum sp. GWF2_44_89]OHD90586.1 MAG: peptidase M48 family protein [Sulfuricurvum sp. RIFOXYD12_FULL_44_77]OHD96028.1 MAG: peptidase M48 family protein [Sulfuricurvum sp. RIFOXYD2_FULL_44_160]DAB37978.1 MAG TPA: peptidase M48 family protein [Sulfuricurvum kujiense]